MIVHFFRQRNCPSYSGKNYGWDAVWQNGRVDWVFNLREARDMVKKLHRGLHPDSCEHPNFFKNFTNYREFGWSVYWGEYSYVS